MDVDYGRPPTGRFATLVPELLVDDIAVSLRFWREALGFEIAYQRPEQSFAYLERPEGAQIMLCQRSGQWETAELLVPYGQGVMFQVYVADLEPTITRLGELMIPLHAGPREVWRRYGDREGGKREIFVLDPNGYLVMMAPHRSPGSPAYIQLPTTSSWRAIQMLVDDLAAEFVAIDEVAAVALGGSRASGWDDDASDIDLYVYSNGPVPVEKRSELAHRRGTPVEIDNRYWETGDEWNERETGIHIDVMYRALRDTRADLSRVLLQHEASIGYTTCVVHNLSTCRVLFDRQGELAALQAFARQPYPEPLARAIIAKNLPLLRDSFGAFGRQIIKAAQREDAVAMNHRTAAFLGSYFDILFAANRATHPGEKRLLQLAAGLPLVPPKLEENVNGLLSAREPKQFSACIGALTNGVLKVLKNLPLDSRGD